MLNLDVAFNFKIAQIAKTSEVSVPNASDNSITLNPFNLLNDTFKIKANELHSFQDQLQMEMFVRLQKYPP